MTLAGAASVALEPAFSVLIAGALPLGSFTECSGLAAEYESFPYPEGGNNLFVHTFRGRLRHPNVTLKGGVTDHSVLLYWALGRGLIPDRADITITFHDPRGRPVRQFHLLGATPVRWSGPTGNASANAVATESLEIAHQGLYP